MGVENFCTKLPKGTPLHQIWSNKSFGVRGSDVVLTPESDEKKSHTLYLSPAHPPEGLIRCFMSKTGILSMKLCYKVFLLKNFQIKRICCP